MKILIQQEIRNKLSNKDVAYMINNNKVLSGYVIDVCADAISISDKDSINLFGDKEGYLDITDEIVAILFAN